MPHSDPVPAFARDRKLFDIPLADVVNSPSGRFSEIIYSKRNYIRGVRLHERINPLINLSRKGTHFEQQLDNGRVVHALRGTIGSYSPAPTESY